MGNSPWGTSNCFQLLLGNSPLQHQHVSDMVFTAHSIDAVSLNWTYLNKCCFFAQCIQAGICEENELGTGLRDTALQSLYNENMSDFTWISSPLRVPCSWGSVCYIGTNAGAGTRQQTQEGTDGPALLAEV